MRIWDEFMVGRKTKSALAAIKPTPDEVESARLAYVEAKQKADDAFKRYLDINDKADGVKPEDLIGKCFVNTCLYRCIVGVEHGMFRVFEMSSIEDESKNISAGFQWVIQDRYQMEEWKEISLAEFIHVFDKLLSHAHGVYGEIEALAPSRGKHWN